MPGEIFDKFAQNLTETQKIKLVRDLKRQIKEDKLQKNPSGRKSNSAIYDNNPCDYSLIEPSEYYMHDVKTFVYNKLKTDTVKIYEANRDSWNGSRFLNNSHKVNPITSREGRKLNLAEYNKKFKEKPV